MNPSDLLIAKYEGKNIRIPKIVVIKIDTTEYWRDDIKQYAGKINSYYMVNVNEVTFCASTQPSFWCDFLYNRFENIEHWTDENGDVTDELIELELENGGELGEYQSEYNNYNPIDEYHVQGVEAKEEIENYGLTEFLETAKEYYTGNPVE